MAEIAQIFVSPLLRALIGNLTESAIQEIKSMLDVEEELEMLRSTVTVIQNVVEDAEERQIHSKSVRNWLGQLKNIAYDADDILDDVAMEARLSTLKYGVESSKRNQVQKFFSSKNPVLYRRNIAHKMSKIRGRQVEKDKIMQLLVSSDDDDELYSIIPIVGTGGLGKTTLAQFFYNDHRVKTHFGLRAWACVSNDFNLLRITMSLFESATGSKCDLSYLDAAQHHLEEKLNGQKFIIVLDDVWGEIQFHTPCF
ncbi:putative disease resistance protein RGA3 [Tasmannia lanceolata]|uniref:putative disease resistance protein RGA3 n=1 Tax=Tasmannia lanceolata TaxID=3420 RepID=UPI0040641076